MGRPALTGRPCTTAWDAADGGWTVSVGVAVPEEAMLEKVLADLD